MTVNYYYNADGNILLENILQFPEEIHISHHTATSCFYCNTMGIHLSWGCIVTLFS